MIARLQGVVVEVSRSTTELVIDCNGVGYGVLASRKLVEQAELEQSLTAIIYTDVKEDSIRLFGFADRTERDVFGLLLRVSGVGTKIARDIVSHYEPTEIFRSLGKQDVAFFQAVKGVGRKTAERIVLELRDRVAEYAVPGLASERFSDLLDVSSGKGKGGTGAKGEMLTISVIADAEAALIALGFSQEIAKRAVSSALNEKSLHENSRAPLDSKLVDPGVLVARALSFL